MRKTNKLVSFALAFCISASLLATAPALKVSAAEGNTVVTTEDETTEQVDSGAATVTDADTISVTEAQSEGILNEDAQMVTDANGFVWSKENASLLVGYTGQEDVVKIPSKCTGIADGAFSLCGMTSVEIPASVTKIGKGIFVDCSYLEKIIVNAGNKIYNSNGNCNAIIETKTNKLVAGCKDTVIPSSVTSIGEQAFYTCRFLTNITIPSSVTSI